MGVPTQIEISFWQRLSEAGLAVAPYFIAVVTSGVISGAFAVATHVQREWPDRGWALWVGRLSSNPGRIHVIWLVMLAGVLYACFEAYDTSNLENHKLKQEAVELSLPQFDLSIGSIDYSNAAEGMLVQLMPTVKNRGAEASIMANSWQLQLKFPDGQILSGQPATLSTEGRRLCLPDGTHQRIIERSDDLSFRASQNIERNGYKDGILGFYFAASIRPQLETDATEMVLTARDIQGREYGVKTTIAYVKAHSTSVFLPSLAHPFPEPGCPANAVTIHIP